MSALTSATGGPDDNDAQAGHLVYVKATRAASVEHDETWVEGGVSPTMNVFDNNGETRATVLIPTLTTTAGATFDGQQVGQLVTVTGDRTHTLTSEGHDASEDGTGRGTPIVAFHQTQDPISEADMSPALGASSIGMGASTATGVRRLTPTECERLQGFPDGWTAVRDTDTPQADSSRYRQLGNAVAVPVVEWIMRRLVAADSDGLNEFHPDSTWNPEATS